jgi:hypothetical protein
MMYLICCLLFSFLHLFFFISLPILFLSSLWSDKFSSGLTSHSFTAGIRLLFTTVKSMLLDPLLLWKVKLSLSSLRM